MLSATAASRSAGRVAARSAASAGVAPCATATTIAPWAALLRKSAVSFSVPAVAAPTVCVTFNVVCVSPLNSACTAASPTAVPGAMTAEPMRATSASVTSLSSTGFRPPPPPPPRSPSSSASRMCARTYSGQAVAGRASRKAATAAAAAA